MSTHLPEGYSSRPVRMDDAHPVAELFAAQSRFLNGVDENIIEIEAALKSGWLWEIFHLESDSLVVLSPEGQIVGYGEMLDVRAPHVSLYSTVIVHPEHMRRGIGSFMADWLEARARMNISKAPAGTQVILHQSAQGNQQAAIDLLARRGYRRNGGVYRMRIDFEQPPDAPVVPPGIILHSVSGEDEERTALFTQFESFLDHRGAVDESFEDYYKVWKDLLSHDQAHDLSLWFLAMDGDQPAGVAVSHLIKADDPEMGWVQSIGVRRPWRKRGLGLALLQRSFRELYARGKRRAGLVVDASSLTGATRLYERAGMRVERTYYHFDLELRSGKDLTRQNID